MVDDLQGSGSNVTFTTLPVDAEIVLSGANIDILAFRTPGLGSTQF